MGIYESPVNMISNNFKTRKVCLNGCTFNGRKEIVCYVLVIDGNDDDEDEEGTANNKTLFSEIQLSGDTEPSSSHETALDIDLRLTRLQRSTAADERKSLGSSSASKDVADLEKVKRTCQVSDSLHSFSFLLSIFLA